MLWLLPYTVSTDKVPGEPGVSIQKVLIEGPSGTAAAPCSSALMLGLYSHNHLATSPIKNWKEHIIIIIIVMTQKLKKEQHNSIKPCYTSSLPFTQDQGQAL